MAATKPLNTTRAPGFNSSMVVRDLHVLLMNGMTGVEAKKEIRRLAIEHGQKLLNDESITMRKKQIISTNIALLLRSKVVS